MSISAKKIELGKDHMVAWVPELPRKKVMETICEDFLKRGAFLRFVPEVRMGMENPEWEGHFVAALKSPLIIRDGANLQSAVDALESFNTEKQSCYDLPSSLEAIVAVAESRIDSSIGIVCSDNVVVRFLGKKISVLPLEKDGINLGVFPVRRF